MSFLDLRLRVFVLMLEPVAKIAHAMNLSLDDVEACAQAVYVKLLRDRGLSLEQIARKSGRSRRNIVSIVQLANNVHEPLLQSERIGDERSVVSWISNNPGQARDQLLKAFPSRQQGDILDAVTRLLEANIVEDLEGNLKLTETWIHFEGESEERKLDSLRHFLSGITQTIHDRFLKRPPEESAFARVLTFRAKESALISLQEEIYRILTKQVTEIDADADDDTSSVSAQTIFAVAKSPSER